MEHVLTDDAVVALYPTYVAAFEPLLTKAAARHILTAEEFAKEMSDPRIEKYVVRDDQGRAVALTTLTSDLTVIDWINAHYYAARYPDVLARDALFYLGYTLVAPHQRRSNALHLMSYEVNRRVGKALGVVGFDICGYNLSHGVGRHIAQIFSNSQRIDKLDVQTYFTADFRGLAPASSEAAARSARDLGPGGVGPVSLVTLADRLDLAGDINAVLASRWPTFLLAGQSGHHADLDQLLMSRPQDQVLLLDADDQVQGVGLSVPLRWDGTLAGLPAGWDDAIEQSQTQQRDGTPPNTTCALSITIPPSAVRQNLAVQLVNGLKAVARAAGSRALLAPIRPILKADYPLVDMASYLGWRTPDGRVFDPWLRLHLREGAELLKVAAESMTISGSVEDWRRWVDAPLPGTGAFVIAGGLSPLQVDVATEIAVYAEPNVWVAHQLIR